MADRTGIEWTDASTPAKPPLVFTARDFPKVTIAWRLAAVMNANRRLAEYYGAAEKVAPTSLKPLSTYPEDRAKLLALANKAEFGDDAAAIELADMVKQILDDERYVESPAPSPEQPAPDLAKMQAAYQIADSAFYRQTGKFKERAHFLAAAGFTLATPPAPQPQGESVTVRKIVQLYRSAEETDCCLTDDGLVWYIDDEIWHLWNDAAPKFAPIRKPEEVAGEVSGI